MLFCELNSTMRHSDAINYILCVIYGTDKHNYIKNTSMEECCKYECTEKLIIDIFNIYYNKHISLVNVNDKFFTVLQVILDEYDYQFNNKNELGHCYLSYWPKYKKMFDDSDDDST